MKCESCPPKEIWSDPQHCDAHWLDHAEHCPHCLAYLEALAQAESIPELQAATNEQSTQDILDQTLRRAKELAGEPDPTRGIPFIPITDRPDLLGQLGNYHVMRVLGKGGMGIVLEAIDIQLQRLVAIKLLAPHLAGSDKARKRFLREARAAAAITHEHVLAIFSVEEIAGLPCIVMPLIHGRTLQQKLDLEGPLDLADTLRIAAQAARGLAAAHLRGLVHRDIKPANLLLESPHERVKLADFGLVQVADDCQLSQEGQVCGTPAFMSPEQARGETCEPRSDLFSLGSVIYAMLTGEPAFRAASTLALLRQVIEETPAALPEKIPGQVRQLVLQLLEKKPSDRPASADVVADALDQMLDRLLTDGPSALESPKSRRLAKRFLAISGACAAIVGIWGATDWKLQIHTQFAQCTVETTQPKVKTQVKIDGEEVTIVSTATVAQRLQAGKDYQVITPSGQDATRKAQIVVQQTKDLVAFVTRQGMHTGVYEIPGLVESQYLTHIPLLRQFDPTALPNVHAPLYPVPLSGHRLAPKPMVPPQPKLPVQAIGVEETEKNPQCSPMAESKTQVEVEVRSDQEPTLQRQEFQMSFSRPTTFFQVVRWWIQSPVVVKRAILYLVKYRQ